MAIFVNEVSRTFGEYLLIPGLTTRQCTPQNVSLTTPLVRFARGQEPRISLNIPFVSAIMQSVSNDTLAIELARNGGLSFIYGSQPIDEQAEMVRRVKKFKAGFVSSDSNIRPDATLRDVLAPCSAVFESLCALPGICLPGYLPHRVVCAGCAGIGVKCNGGSCVCSGDGAEVLLSCHFCPGCWREPLAPSECCSSVVARGWVCTIDTFLYGGTIPRMLRPGLLFCTRPTCTYTTLRFYVFDFIPSFSDGFGDFWCSSCFGHDSFGRVEPR